MLPPSGEEGHSFNENAAFPDITNTTCNRSNQNTRLPDTYSHSTNEHPGFPDTTKTTKRDTMLTSIPCFFTSTMFTDLKLKNIVQDLLVLNADVFEDRL